MVLVHIQLVQSSLTHSQAAMTRSVKTARHDNNAQRRYIIYIGSITPSTSVFPPPMPPLNGSFGPISFPPTEYLPHYQH